MPDRRLEGVELEVGNSFDQVFNMRTEVHCRSCKGHLVSPPPPPFLCSVSLYQKQHRIRLICAT